MSENKNKTCVLGSGFINISRDAGSIPMTSKGVNYPCVCHCYTISTNFFLNSQLQSFNSFQVFPIAITAGDIKSMLYLLLLNPIVLKSSLLKYPTKLKDENILCHIYNAINNVKKNIMSKTFYKRLKLF